MMLYNIRPIMLGLLVGLIGKQLKTVGYRLSGLGCIALCLGERRRSRANESKAKSVE